jgi:hypothetical protein
VRIKCTQISRVEVEFGVARSLYITLVGVAASLKVTEFVSDSE